MKLLKTGTEMKFSVPVRVDNKRNKKSFCVTYWSMKW